MPEGVVTKPKIPFRSRLGAYEDELRQMVLSGFSTRRISAEMSLRHGLSISHNAVASFLRTHKLRHRHFLDGIPEGRRLELMRTLKAMWTHDSTAIEGNTLSLGDTLIVLQYGLTVKGKPLKDHDDVIAHANAVDFIQELVKKGKIAADDLLKLHQLVVLRDVHDIYKPVGNWKREDNGTYNEEDGRPVYMPYASADATPQLMFSWIDDFNSLFDVDLTPDEAIDAYLRSHVSFVRIHPFFDGNGRLARLLSNLPVLFAGYPPIIVPTADRSEYIRALWTYQRSVGTISLSSPELLPDSPLLAPMRAMIKGWWQSTLDLVADARTNVPLPQK